MPAGDMDAVEYAIGVNNRFGLISSDMNDDPLELIQAALDKPAKKEKDTKGKGKKEVKPTKGSKDKSVKTEAAPVAQEPKKQEGIDRPRGRGRGGRGRGGDRPRGRGRGFGSDSPRDENAASFGGSKGACHRCHEDGHFARECPNVESAPRSGTCHKCGEEGHFARQCPKSGPPGGGACHKCHEVGHFARECPKNNQSSGGFGESSGGFGSSQSGGFGAPGDVDSPSDGGFGVPSSSGFGAPSSGGFGAPSGGDDDTERRGGRGGFRGGRGGRGGRGRGRGREFDRRSGSDRSSSVKQTDKRDGAGSYNWGNAKDDLEASEEQQGGFGAPKDSEEYTADNTETQEGGNESSEENKENAEPKEITYEEWKSQQEERSKPQHNIRQANEGEKLKGVRQLKKPTEEENEEDGSLFFPKKYYEERLKTSGRVKEHFEHLNFQFVSGDNRHLDTDRGRRGGRGGRGKGGRRDNESGFGNSTKQLQLENNEEFPSL